MDVSFYYMHRLFHTRLFYERFHKLHHEWKSPIALATLYAHPVEHLSINIFLVLLGPTIVGCHLATTYIWISMATLNSIKSHCGNHFPLSVSPQYHDYHHVKFNQCYGVSGILDSFHSTNDKFVKNIHSKRNKTFFSLSPIDVLVPRKEIPNK